MRAAGTEKLPCIKISNQMLEKAGFALGDFISVTYKRNVIVIKRSKDNHHE
jgi:hypothetical protein